MRESGLVFLKVKPFLEFENRIAILLGLTSNIGANDIQLKTTNNDDFIYMEMIKSSKNCFLFKLKFKLCFKILVNIFFVSVLYS